MHLLQCSYQARGTQTQTCHAQHVPSSMLCTKTLHYEMNAHAYFSMQSESIIHSWDWGQVRGTQGQKKPTRLHSALECSNTNKPDDQTNITLQC